jgi:lipoyl(octanoyl) transferase
VTMENTINSVARHFGRVFEHQVLWLESIDALLSSAVR